MAKATRTQFPYTYENFPSGPNWNLWIESLSTLELVGKQMRRNFGSSLLYEDSGQVYLVHHWIHNVWCLEINICWMNEGNNKKKDGGKEYLLVDSLGSFNSSRGEWAPRGLLLYRLIHNQLHPVATGLFMYPFLNLMHKCGLFTLNADLWHSAVQF